MPSINFDPIFTHYKICLILRYHLKENNLIEFIEKARLTSKYSLHDILKILYNLPEMKILWWKAILNSIKVQMSMKIYPKEFDYFLMHINDKSLDIFIDKSFYERNQNPYERNQNPYEIHYEDFYNKLLLNKIDPYIIPYTPYIPKSKLDIPLQVKPYKGISININNSIILNPLT